VQEAHDPELGAEFFDERHDHFYGWSSSAGKKAEA